MGLIRFLEKKKAKDFRRKHKIGLCLSGGGTRGFCYLGAFKALEEAGIKFDAVAGTSIGSIFASLYACGLSYDEMSKLTSSIKDTDFKNFPLDPFIKTTSNRVEKLIKDKLPIKNLEDAEIELYIPAVDLHTGMEIDFSSGDASKVVAGSCAVPGVFPFVKYGEYVLMDGGCRNNIPADVLKEHGCDYVVTIDCNAGRGRGTKSSKFIDRFIASLDIASANNSRIGLKSSDIVVSPDVDRFSPLTLKDKDSMIEEGYKATKQALFRIRALFDGKHKGNDTKEDKVNY